MDAGLGSTALMVMCNYSINEAGDHIKIAAVLWRCLCGLRMDASLGSMAHVVNLKSMIQTMGVQH